MTDKELVELLALELELVLRVFLDGLVVGDGVVLRAEERLEGHHGWRRTVVGDRLASAVTTSSVAARGAAVASVVVLSVSSSLAASVVVVPKMREWGTLSKSGSNERQELDLALHYTGR